MDLTALCHILHLSILCVAITNMVVYSNTEITTVRLGLAKQQRVLLCVLICNIHSTSDSGSRNEEVEGSNQHV